MRTEETLDDGSVMGALVVLMPKIRAALKSSQEYHVEKLLKWGPNTAVKGDAYIATVRLRIADGDHRVCRPLPSAHALPSAHP